MNWLGEVTESRKILALIQTALQPLVSFGSPIKQCMIRQVKETPFMHIFSAIDMSKLLYIVNPPIMHTKKIILKLQHLPGYTQAFDHYMHHT